MEFIDVFQANRLNDLPNHIKHFLLIEDNLKRDITRLRSTHRPLYRSDIEGTKARLHLINIHGTISIPAFDLQEDRIEVANFLEQHYSPILASLELPDDWKLFHRISITCDDEVKTALMKAGACAVGERNGKFEVYLRNSEEEFRKNLQWPEDLSPIIKIVAKNTSFTLLD